MEDGHGRTVARRSFLNTAAGVVASPVLASTELSCGRILGASDRIAHSVACIMAAQSYRQGKRLYCNARSEEIADRAPAAS